MIYVPVDNPACVVLRDANVIRVYDSIPQSNSTVGYTDYYINQHYIFNSGSQSFGNYSTGVSCRNSNELTNSWVYRSDLPDILISFLCILLIVYIPLRLILKPLKGVFRL